MLSNLNRVQTFFKFEFDCTDRRLLFLYNLNDSYGVRGRVGASELEWAAALARLAETWL